MHIGSTLPPGQAVPTSKKRKVQAKQQASARQLLIAHEEDEKVDSRDNKYDRRQGEDRRKKNNPPLIYDMRCQEDRRSQDGYHSIDTDV